MVKVLKVDLYDKTIPKAVNSIIEDIAQGNSRENRMISATGAHGIIIAQRDEAFRQVLSEFYWNLPDGMPGVWVGRMKGAKEMRQCNGPGFFEEMMKESAGKQVTHFFCGGKDGVADQLKASVANNFNNHGVVGTYCPPFRELSEEEFVALGKQINDSGANIVWVGISTPKQEKFAYKLRNYCKANYIVTVGAAFDFHTGNLEPAPKWISKIGMEWFYRLTKEPKRLASRYGEVVPLFIYYNIKELITR